MTEKNPWLSITEGNVKIAECDVPYFERKGSVEEYAENINLKDDEVELTFDCMPDPFSGSPNSKVYCLNKNPGKPDFCFKEDEAFLNATIQNLRLRSDSCSGQRISGINAVKCMTALSGYASVPRASRTFWAVIPTFSSSSFSPIIPVRGSLFRSTYPRMTSLMR